MPFHRTSEYVHIKGGGDQARPHMRKNARRIAGILRQILISEYRGAA